MVQNNGGMKNSRGKPKELGEKPGPVPLRPRSHMGSPGIQHGLRGEKPVSKAAIFNRCAAEGPQVCRGSLEEGRKEARKNRGTKR
jgi:hypothetical protein